jgi:hypothetical protein
MMNKAARTMADQREAEIANREHRASDPIELAKLALRRAGIVAFSHSLLVPGSTQIVVGVRAMQPDDFLAFADRHGRW